MDKRKIILMTLLLALFYGCWNNSNNNKKKQDDFYTITGGWDWVRVPLLKPYEVKKADPEIKTNSWGVEFFNTLGTYNVKCVDVQDSVIYILSGKVDEKNDSALVNLRNVPTGWYVIDTREKTEKGFAVEKGFMSESEFNAYIKENKYPTPQWLNVDSLSNALAKGKKLPWFPK